MQCATESCPCDIAKCEKGDERDGEKNEKKNAIVNNQWCKMFIIVNVMKTNRRSSEITTNHKRK